MYQTNIIGANIVCWSVGRFTKSQYDAQNYQKNCTAIISCTSAVCGNLKDSSYN